MDNTDEKKKILAVDDDETQLTILKTILSVEYNVITAESGKQAVEHLYSGFIPDLILLDIIMPEMDGFEVFNRIRAISELQKIPIAFLTSVSGAAEMQQAWDIRAVDYITKPYSKENLLRRIHNALKQGTS